MKRITMTLIALMIAGGLLAQPMMSGPRGMKGKWWTSTDVQQNLNLSEQQVEELNRIHLASAEFMIDLEAAMEKQHLRFQEIMDTDPFNPEEALRQMDALSKARQKMQNLRHEMMIKTRTVLSTEQWLSLKSMRNERRADRKERRKELRKNRRNGDCPMGQDRSGDGRGPGFGSFDRD